MYSNHTFKIFVLNKMGIIYFYLIRSITLVHWPPPTLHPLSPVTGTSLLVVLPSVSNLSQWVTQLGAGGRQKDTRRLRGEPELLGF